MTISNASFSDDDDSEPIINLEIGKVPREEDFVHKNNECVSCRKCSRCHDVKQHHNVCVQISTKALLSNPRSCTQTPAEYAKFLKTHPGRDPFVSILVSKIEKRSKRLEAFVRSQNDGYSCPLIPGSYFPMCFECDAKYALFDVPQASMVHLIANNYIETKPQPKISSSLSTSDIFAILFLNDKGIVLDRVDVQIPVGDRAGMTHTKLINLIRDSTTILIDSDRVSGYLQKASAKPPTKVVPTRYSTDVALQTALICDHGKERLYLLVSKIVEKAEPVKRKRKTESVAENTLIFEKIKQDHLNACATGEHTGKGLMCVNLRCGGCKVLTASMIHAWSNQIASVSPSHDLITLSAY
jgi:hypothetical protein